LEISWQFTRYAERWNRDYFFQPVRDFYQNHGKTPQLLTDMKTRIDAEKKPGKSLLLKLGRTYQECGYPEKATEVYRRLIAENPYDDETPIALADLLGKLKRGDEAVQVLQNRKGASSLQEEVNKTIQVIRVQFQNDRAVDARSRSNLYWLGKRRPDAQPGRKYLFRTKEV
jgi:tetratricopeptide (TPR) repeat protein